VAGRTIPGHRIPFLSSAPSECLTTLNELFIPSRAHETCVIGSSLGGFWSSYVVERNLAQKAVLVNPAVAPHTRFHELVGQELENYYTGERYMLNDQDLNVLLDCDCAKPAMVSSYYLLLQKGDEVLDYRLAYERYNDCKKIVEEGGNHSFENFENHLPNILSFFNV